MFRTSATIGKSPIAEKVLGTVYRNIRFQKVAPQSIRNIQTITIGTIADSKERSAVAILKYTKSLPNPDESFEAFHNRNNILFSKILRENIDEYYLQSGSQIMLIVVNPSLMQQVSEEHAYRVQGGHISLLIAELTPTGLIAVPQAFISKTVKVKLGEVLKKNNAQLGRIILINQQFKGQANYERVKRVFEHLWGISSMNQEMSLYGSDTFCIAIPMAVSRVSVLEIIQNIKDYMANNEIYDRQLSSCGNAVLYAVSREENGTLYTQDAATNSAQSVLPATLLDNFAILVDIMGLSEVPEKFYLNLCQTTTESLKKIHIPFKENISTIFDIETKKVLICRNFRPGW